MGPSLLCLRLRKFLKRGELLVDLGEGLLQHLPMRSVGGGLHLVSEARAGEQKALALAVEFLLGRRKTWASGLARVGHLGLLLFYRLTFPTARHSGPASRLVKSLVETCLIDARCHRSKERPSSDESPVDSATAR